MSRLVLAVVCLSACDPQPEMIARPFAEEFTGDWMGVATIAHLDDGQRIERAVTLVIDRSDDRLVLRGVCFSAPTPMTALGGGESATLNTPLQCSEPAPDCPGAVVSWTSGSVALTDGVVAVDLAGWHILCEPESPPARDVTFTFTGRK